MFHFSLPVARYRQCLDFYRSCFSAEIVELGPTAANLFVFGAQITLHDEPASPMTGEARRSMHFGQIVDDEEWANIRDRLLRSGHELLRCIDPSEAPNGRGKLVVQDPSGNLVEVNSRPRP